MGHLDSNRWTFTAQMGGQLWQNELLFLEICSKKTLVFSMAHFAKVPRKSMRLGNKVQ